jgi:formylglycine-generating enzyme
VETAVADTMFFDTAWESLPEGTYKWAVKARYTVQLSPAVFSNELEKSSTNSAPVVSNVHAAQRDDASMLIDIFYDVYDPDGDALTISLEVSHDDGASWDLSCEEILANSEIGAGILSGTDRHIVWDAATEHPNLLYGSNFRFRITADDGVGDIPDGFVFVEGGTFNNGTSDVTLSSFYMDKYELTQAEYQAVMGTNPASGYGVGSNYPVYYVSWFDAIEYCNRRSMQEGLTPCYSYSSYGTNPDDWPTGWNTSSGNHSNVSCNWTANGYRLPTEMEWMFAAKGGNQSQGYTYSGSNTIGNVAWYFDNSYNMGSDHPDYGTHDVGELAANELGTFDMSGNVFEWCWDIYGSYPSGSQNNPTGASSGSNRVVRGGSWGNIANACTVSYRSDYSATSAKFNLGFRILRVSP